MYSARGENTLIRNLLHWIELVMVVPNEWSRDIDSYMAVIGALLESSLYPLMHAVDIVSITSCQSVNCCRSTHPICLDRLSYPINQLKPLVYMAFQLKPCLSPIHWFSSTQMLPKVSTLPGLHITKVLLIESSI